MEVRSWPSRRSPPPGWVISPDLSEIYQRSIIVRKGSISRVRREIGGRKKNHLERQGKLQMILGSLLMGGGVYGAMRRR
jgi:hypothetical protein